MATITDHFGPNHVYLHRFSASAKGCYRFIYRSTQLKLKNDKIWWNITIYLQLQIESVANTPNSPLWIRTRPSLPAMYGYYFPNRRVISSFSTGFLNFHYSGRLFHTYRKRIHRGFAVKDYYVVIGLD